MKLNAILSDGWSVQSICWMRYGCYCTFWNYIASALSAHTLHMIHLCVYRTYLYTLCIASPYSLHISVYCLCTSLYTLICVSLILFHTLCMLICVYCLTGNNAAPQSVGLLHAHRLQPHATGNKHGCCVCVWRVQPETETPIGTFGGQCSLPAILQVSHSVKICDLVLHVGIMWASCEHHVSIMWASCEHHVSIMWASCEHHVGIMWASCGHHVSIMWALCEPCL